MTQIYIKTHKILWKPLKILLKRFRKLWRLFLMFQKINFKFSRFNWQTGNKYTKFYPKFYFENSNSMDWDDFDISRKDKLSRALLSKSENFLAKCVGVATNWMEAKNSREKYGCLEILAGLHFPISFIEKLVISGYIREIA